MMTMLSTTLLVATLSSLPAQPKMSLEISKPKTSEVSLDRYNTPQRVVRKRTFGRRSAIFSVGAQKLETPTLFQLEAKTQDGVEHRWSCLALESTDECFKNRLVIPYQAKDEAVTLLVTAKLKTDPVVIAKLQKMKLYSQTKTQPKNTYARR